MSVSVIIPVYKEEESLPVVLSQFDADDNYEIVIVDDSSDDLTADAVKPFTGKLNINYIHRRQRLGLSSAVIEGFSAAKGDILICMDGDGSHPVSIIPALVEAMKNNQMVIASRYLEGGSVDPHWNLFRRMISRICCFLSTPLNGVKDPMSGCFALSAEVFDSIKERLKPVSYKIALEISVRGRIKNIAEVPFHFVSRVEGKSKVTLRVITGMIMHLLSLYCFKIFGRKA